MYILNYNNGVIRYSEELDLPSLIPQLTARTITSIVDTVKKKVIFVKGDAIVSEDLPEIEKVTDEQIKEFQDNLI